MPLSSGTLNFQILVGTSAARTATFGALTLLASGGYQIFTDSNNPITSATDAGTGTASGYSVSTGGVITPSSNGSLSAQDGNTIVVNCDQGQFVVTLSVEANVYTCNTNVELKAAFDAARTADTGATVKCRAGFYTDGLLDIKNITAHTQRITITSDDPLNMASFWDVDIRTWDNVTIDGVEITRDSTAIYGGALVKIINGSGTTWDKRITIKNCRIFSPRSPGGVTSSFTDPALYTVGSGGVENWASWAITTAGGDTANHAWNIEILDNDIFYVKEAIFCNSARARLDIIGNNITYFWGDCIAAPTGPTQPTFNMMWNFIAFNIGKLGDYGETLHSDAVQWRGASTDTINATIIGNRVIGGDFRGNALQNIFGDDWALTYGLSGALVAYNIAHCVGSNAGVKLNHIKSVTAHDNLMVTTSNSAAIEFRLGEDWTEGAHVAKYNVAGSFFLPTSGGDGGTATMDATDNYVPTYETEFVGPPDGDFTRSPGSLEELMTWFASKSGGTMFTANKNGGPLGTNNSRVDYVNRTYTALSA